MKSATENLQKCMENVVHEQQIHSEGHMTEEQHESMVRPLRDRHTGMINVKSAMCHWLGLTSNTSDAFETSKTYNVPRWSVFPITFCGKIPAFQRLYLKLFVLKKLCLLITCPIIMFLHISFSNKFGERPV
jgi:hypothetical protein